MANYSCIRIPHEQSKTSFRVPQNEYHRKKWEDALGMPLEKTHRVCTILRKLMLK